MNYAILHAHSEYSTRDSLIPVAEMPVLAARAGWKACAITDHGGIEGVPKFMRAARKAGIKPIAGCELYVQTPDMYSSEKYQKTDKVHHLTVLCKNAKGFRSLTRLLSAGHQDHYDARRQKAILPLNFVLATLEECVILSGCFSGPFWRQSEAAMVDLVNFMEHFRNDLYLELQPHYDWDEQINLNRKIVDLAEALNLKTVVTPDCHFGLEEERQFHDALLAVADRKSIFDPNVWKFSTGQCFIASPEQLMVGLAKAGVPDHMARASLDNTAIVADGIDDWKWEDLPASRLPEIAGDMSALSWAGLDSKGLRSDSVYADRLERELRTFREAGLDRYFLLVRRCVEVLRSEGAEIGPRGSVGGSLVAYALGLSPLDPVKHGLSFERFYAPGRIGWPDIDLDIPVRFRSVAPEILRKEFGHDKVAQISNYMTFGLRMAVKDAAKAYGVKILDDSKAWEDDKELKDTKDPNDVLKIAPGQELAQKCPPAIEFAKKLYSKVRQYGAHAGGFVISADPLTEGRSAIVHRGKDIALSWDMEIAEELGFVKLDFLGIASLDAISEIGKRVEGGIDWNSVPLDDEEVLHDFGRGLTAGVPQFLSPGMRTFVEMLKPMSFEELVWANAAFRPGGLGQMSPRDMAAAYRRDPGSIIIYQEEIMSICVELAGFSWMDADKVRKVVAKSMGKEEFKKWQDRFVEGCQKTGVFSAEEAAAFWDKLAEFGRYSFNKCLHPSERVLLYNGGNKAIGELRPGEILRGPDGGKRVVKNVWSNRTLSVRITLDDGTSLVCSPNHRFLGDNGTESVESLFGRGGRIACEARTGGEGRMVLHRLFQRLPYEGGAGDPHQELFPLARSQETNSSGDLEQDMVGSVQARADARRSQNAQAAQSGAAGGRSRSSQALAGNEPGEVQGYDSQSAGRISRVGQDQVQDRGGDQEDRSVCGGSQEVHQDRRQELRDRRPREPEGLDRRGWSSPLQADLRGGPVLEDEGTGPSFGRGSQGPWGCLPSENRPGLLHDVWEDQAGVQVGDREEDHESETRGLVFRKIVGFDALGPQDLVDIEVDADHLFLLASGAVSHNSHATSYSWNAYRIAWSKRRHSLSAFVSLLNADPDLEETLRDEAPHFGVRVLPPHADKSTLEWAVEGGSIRAPIQKIWGIDLRIAKAILKRRQEGGPFTDLATFKKRMAKVKYPDGLAEAAFADRWPEEHFDLPLKSPKKMLPKDFAKQTKSCDRCELRSVCKAPIPIEANKTNVMIIGEVPGAREDYKGRHFVGASGEMIWGLLSQHEIYRDDVTVTNATKCFPNGPTYDVKVCSWIHDEIKALQPPLILVVGKRAWEKIGGKGGITKVNGQVHQIGGSKVVPCIHPAAVLRDRNLTPELERAVSKFSKLFKTLVPKEIREAENLVEVEPNSAE